MKFIFGKNEPTDRPISFWSVVVLICSLSHTIIYGKAADVVQCSSQKSSVVVNHQVTILLSPPSGQTSTPCSYRFRKVSNICQIHLNFVAFSTTSANFIGDCDRDRLHIKNSFTAGEDFTTCGNLTGQHMHLTFGDKDIEVTPMLVDTYSSYKIVATRIACGSTVRAPGHCLQYFTQTTGVVKSFDFGGQQQNNQRYSVCVRPHYSSSKIRWQTCRNLEEGSTAFDIITPHPTGSETGGCLTDFVQVKGGERVCDRFPQMTSECGARIPYELLVNFDEKEITPPPPEFDIPIDPHNCASECVNYPGFICHCVGASPNQVCMCIAEQIFDPIHEEYPEMPLPEFENSVADPANCIPTCENSAPSGWDCTCVGNDPKNQSCMCYLSAIVDPSAPGTGMEGEHSDIENTGFCLEYSQI